MGAIDSACRAGNMTLAMRLSSEAVARGVEHPVVLMLAAHGSLSRGVADEALAFALRARTLNPRDPEILNAYGLALTAAGRPREALAVYDNALRQAPARPGVHFNKGCAYDEMNDTRRARQCFERALALQPANAQFLGRLAHLLALQGDATQARSFGERAVRISAGEPTATLALAMSDLADKAPESALTRVGPMLGGPVSINRSIAEGLAADAFDALGRTDEAFRAYSASTATRRSIFRAKYEGHGEGARSTAERLASYFRDCPPWQPKPARTSDRTHVFLVGFPRSGTTLLEQVLAAHPDVESMEERACLADSVSEFLTTADDLERLRLAPDEELEPWREAYWSRAAECGVAPAKPVFIDKLPLNTVCLPLIGRLFPDSKILFALRDPADVVWSCFRRRFGMSEAMYEFLTLEGAARYYDAVMTMADLYRRKLPLHLHELRYEKLVEDFEGETRKTCAFLNLDWRADLANFADRARARGTDTPSSAQVARGLYNTGIGQWQPYEKHLASMLALIAPWRIRFGYA
jgi:Flp pilus assembly protein TadD